jgi:hypothetical protein
MIAERHALVKVGGFWIPLIGIEAQGAIEECDYCHDLFNLTSVQWNRRGNQLLCQKCRANWGDANEYESHNFRLQNRL